MIRNGSNIFFKAPRRIGRSSLIKHLFRQEEILSGYNTMFIDIYGTKNMDEFINEFQGAFMDAPFANTEVGKRKITELLRSVFLQVNTVFAGNLSGVGLGLREQNTISITLKEMFRFLENTSKPNLVVFDEFQVINDYPEKAAAILRTFIQQMNNTQFIFSGSSRHLLDRMFEYPNEPFFRSAASLGLGPIGMEPYVEFCCELFHLYGKSIEKEAIELVYQLFSANTYDMQEVMKETFPEIRPGDTAVTSDIRSAINRLLGSRDEEFRAILDRISNEKNRRVLKCIAKEGIASELTSGSMIKRYGLDTASSVQNALNVLMGNNLRLIVRAGEARYQLRDRFFELWLARRNNLLEGKFNSAPERFSQESKMGYWASSSKPKS